MEDWNNVLQHARRSGEVGGFSPMYIFPCIKIEVLRESVFVQNNKSGKLSNDNLVISDQHFGEAMEQKWAPMGEWSKII